MKKYILFLILFSCIILSCEHEIHYKQKDIQPKLIMNALINADSLENILYLNYTGATVIRMVEDASLEVWVNGELKEKPPMRKSVGRQAYFVLTSRFFSGDRVRIEARTSDGKHHVWVEETVPFPVADLISVDTVTISDDLSNHIYGGKKVRIKTRFKDRPGERNYYRIVFEQRNSISGITLNKADTLIKFKEYNYWPWEDVVLTDGRPATSEELNSELFERVTNIYGVFNDSRFMDGEYTMTTQVSFYNRLQITEGSTTHLAVDLVVRLLSITESGFYYFTTLNYLDSDIREEMLDDPVRIPTNVHGGTGFVGFSTEVGKMFPKIVDKEFDYYIGEEG